MVRLRARARAALMGRSASLSRGPHSSRSGSALSQRAWRRAERVLPTPAGRSRFRWSPRGGRCRRTRRTRRCALVVMKVSVGVRTRGKDSATTRTNARQGWHIGRGTAHLSMSLGRRPLPVARQGRRTSARGRPGQRPRTAREPTTGDLGDRERGPPARRRPIRLAESKVEHQLLLHGRQPRRDQCVRRVRASASRGSRTLESLLLGTRSQLRYCR
ncbi:Uncharacterised protein [Prescottella equi]|nr:Uncharacterised protein [Prescottella equi]SUE19001.1 Uncharacterised protein [Prescottella equi]